MITVNGEEFPWHEGLNVSGLLREKRYTYPSLVISINGELVNDGKYNTTMIADGDDVKVIHLIAGG